MPRSARLDAPGVLHHVIGRGIEKGPIFLTDEDRRKAYGVKPKQYTLHKDKAKELGIKTLNEEEFKKMIG